MGKLIVYANNMNSQLDTFGKLFVTFVVIFCGFGFYRFFLDSWPNISQLLAIYAFWLIISFILIALSIGIGKGINRARIKVPKKPAAIVFIVAGLLFLAAGILNDGM